MNQQLFRDADIQWLLAQYADWLLSELGPQKAALVINRHSQFFEQLANGWQGSIPSYSELLAHFRVSGLRKYLLVMHWLIETQHVDVDPKLKDDCSEQDQLDQLISSFPRDTLASNVLKAYLLNLQQRQAKGRIQLRSIRLAIKPAVALMACTDYDGLMLPTIRSLRKYLLAVSGQTAAVTGFLNFLNQQYGTQLNAFDAYKGLKNGVYVRSKMEEKLYELRLSDKSPERELAWVQTALCYFHGYCHP
nr:hypothetical protein [uncultured Acinetobacter sp.]